MDYSEKLCLDVTLDLVAFYDILRGDFREQIDVLAKDLEKCCRGNPKVEILHTGSGFEGLSLPHLESHTWNTDADHMLIRTDITVLDKSEGFAVAEKKAECEETRASGPDSAGYKAPDSIDEPSTVFIYNGLHAGYVHVSSKLFRPTNAASVQDHCLKNTDFIEKNKDLISLSNTVMMATDESGSITGPSYSLPYTSGTFTVQRDFVYGLKCKFWPSQSEEWINRDRPHSWPNSELVSAIVNRGCNLVPVGSHTSALRELEWRFSFSAAELMLVESLSEDQKLAYSILKALIKTEMKLRGVDVFASYHLKTALFWFVEQKGIASWEKQSLGANIIELLDFLTDFYANGSLPNYFIPKNNMIDHRSPDEILSTWSVLVDIKGSITLSLCRYVETNQSLPVFFDKPLTDTFKEHSDEFIQICKYNLLLMALVDILKRLKKTEQSVNDSKARYLVDKAHFLHKSAIEGNIQRADSLQVSSNSVCDSRVPEASSVLGMLEEFLASDQIKVTESSAVVLAVFNVVLALLPRVTDGGVEINKQEFHNYLSIPAFKESLFWAASLHEKYSDVIYDFVVKKWTCGPQFHTEDEEARKVMKLLMVILGKPTKQASAVTGSLAKRSVEGQRFLLMRSLAEYLLHVHLESSYVVLQAAAFLMGKPVLSEIYNYVNWAYFKRSKLRAVELILSKTELRAQLSEEEFDGLVQMQHQLTT